ncbi:MAG: ABC transporter substrate-binding protein [Candidatus Krumholzibacteriota bacterium]|nr:ABC transporter substrate-binding protein [Candidatus Krumholzibacteriota bacterium]
MAAAILVAGCGAEEATSVVKLALETEPATADPAFAVDYSSGLLAALVHGGLVAFDEDGALVADLAKSWRVSADGLTWRFVLAGRRFADGTPVTASAVAASFRRLLSPDTRSPRWWVLAPVAGAAAFHAGGAWEAVEIEAPDDSTLSFRLERPAAHFLSLLAMPAAGIVCSRRADSLGAAYGRAPLGAGIWTVGAWREGDEVELSPNPFGLPRPIVGGLVFRIIPEAMTRVAEFEVGGLDLLEVPRAELAMWRTAGVDLLSSEELRVVYIGLALERPPLDDPRVRRALNHAIDVETIIARILFGAGRRARGVVPAGLRAWPEQAEAYPYDPARARRLLAEAGLSDGFEMEIWQRDNPEGGRILESVQGYLAAVGVQARLVTREWGAFKEAIANGAVDAFYLDWFADYPDAENFLVPLFYSANRGGGGNRTGYANAVVDSLLDTAAAAANGERAKLYREAEEIVYRDAPWIFLWFPRRYEVVSPRLEGYQIPVIFNGQRWTGVSLKGVGG